MATGGWGCGRRRWQRRRRAFRWRLAGDGQSRCSGACFHLDLGLGDGSRHEQSTGAKIRVRQVSGRRMRRRGRSCTARLAGAHAFRPRECWDACATGLGRTRKARHALWHALRDLSCSAEGSSPWRGDAGSPACGARPPKGRYGPRKTAQRKRGVGVVLT